MELIEANGSLPLQQKPPPAPAQSAPKAMRGRLHAATAGRGAHGAVHAALRLLAFGARAVGLVGAGILDPRALAVALERCRRLALLTIGTARGSVVRGTLDGTAILVVESHLVGAARRR